MKRLIKRSVVYSSLVALGVFSFLQLLEARNPSGSANLFAPATDASPYLTVYGSQTIQPWRYHTGLYLDYSRNPLQVGIGGVSHQVVIKDIIYGNLFGTLGLTDWMHVSLNVPVAFFENYYAPTSSIPGDGIAQGTNQKVLKMGDVRLESKIRLLDIDRHNFGISILPFVYAPTGSGNYFTGNNRFSGGAQLVMDVNIADRASVALNLGYQMKKKATIVGTDRDDSLLYGLGANLKALDWMHIMAEVYGNTNTGNMFKRTAESPLEADGGVRFFPSKPEGLAITVGGGAGLNFGYGAPDIRGIVGLSYPNPKRVNLPPAPPPPPPPPPPAKIEKEKIVITRKVHFEFDKSVIRPVSFRILDAVVEVLKDNPDVTKVRIDGHTDGKGTDPYNMKLGERRAKSVKDYLVSHGVSADRLSIQSFGESKPVSDNETPEGRARNRRVEFSILEQDGQQGTN
ncbi:MAG: OmpA family protein [Deltaproteobacteria bacterium]|nr:MAG: OmpA family protein [Deltaproteobacteria bacterium]